MSASSERELQARVEDLVRALKIIGSIVADPALKPAQRTERVLAILSMYDAAPAPKAAL